MRKRNFDGPPSFDKAPPVDTGRVFKYARLSVCHKLTPELIEAFCEKVVEGIPATSACDFFGISDKTFQMWRRLGEAYLEGASNPKAQEIHGIFVCGLRLACAEWVAVRVKGAQTGTGTWFRDLKLLAIRDRNNFSEQAQGGSDDAFSSNDSFL